MRSEFGQKNVYVKLMQKKEWGDMENIIDLEYKIKKHHETTQNGPSVVREYLRPRSSDVPKGFEKLDSAEPTRENDVPHS